MKSLIIIAFSFIVAITDTFESGFWSMKSRIKCFIKSLVARARLGLKSYFRLALEKSRMMERYLIMDLRLTCWLNESTMALALKSWSRLL